METKSQTVGTAAVVAITIAYGGDADEDLLTAARREFEEETGARPSGDDQGVRPGGSGRPGRSAPERAVRLPAARAVALPAPALGLAFRAALATTSSATKRASAARSRAGPVTTRSTFPVLQWRSRSIFKNRRRRQLADLPTSRRWSAAREAKQIILAELGKLPAG